jgi:hypothetical protein
MKLSATVKEAVADAQIEISQEEGSIAQWCFDTAFTWNEADMRAPATINLRFAAVLGASGETACRPRCCGMSSAPLPPARASTSWPHTTCGAPVRLVAIESEGVPICRLWLPEMQ